MRKKHLATWLLLLCCMVGGWSQNPKMKRADLYMKALDYPAAIALYRELATKNNLPEAKIRLAEAYRKVQDYPNAEHWYAEAVKAGEAPPTIFLHYGQVLQRNGKCEEAQSWYNYYLQLRPYDMRKRHLQRACDYEAELMRKSIQKYAIHHPDFNAPAEDIGPAFYENGLVFASGRSDATASKRIGFLDLFFVEIQPGETPDALPTYGQPERFSNRLQSRYHEGMVAFNHDFTELFVTRNQSLPKGADPQATIPLEIIQAVRRPDGVWSEPQPLPFCNTRFSVAHPSLRSDGRRLFFSSDMPGGFGGKDIYYVDRYEDGRWGPPVNLGPGINTESDELFPFYFQGRLYFASDGHVGLGGLDIFYVDDLSNNDWSAVENPGAPLNTAYDDFGLIWNQEGISGYFTSNRPGGLGADDIYMVTTYWMQIPLDVVDVQTGTPLLMAYVRDTTGRTTVQMNQGRPFVSLPAGACAPLVCQMEGYETRTQMICADPNNPQAVQILMTPKVRGMQIIGRIFDQQSGKPLAGVRVQPTSKDCAALPVVTSDANGTFVWQTETLTNCCIMLRLEKNGYFAQTMSRPICLSPEKPRVQLEQLYLQPFSIQEDTPSAEATIHSDAPFRASARPTREDGSIAYVLNIYYDFEKTNIREDAVPELQKLQQLLQDNPDLLVEISSHTDSRGSERYNQRLSQKRAEAVVNWLAARGIQRSRLVPKGYGENLLVNDCKDDVPCSDEAHQLNRRTEFRVIGRVGERNP